MKKITKKAVTSKIFPVLIWMLLLLWTLLFGFMLVWAILTSLKSGIDFYYNPMGFPSKRFGGWKFDNFLIAARNIKVINGTKTIGYWQMLGNSLLYAGGSSFFAVLTACMASYCVAKFRHLRWVNWVWGVVLVTNYLPISASLAGNLKFLTDLHLYDNIFGMWLWGAGAFGAMFLFYYATWKGVSWGYAEAALVDGASHLRVFWQIMFPMTRTIFGVLFLQSFIGMWNDYMTPMLYLPSMPTIAFGSWQFQFDVTGEISDITVRLAGLLIILLPVFVLFMIFKDKLMGSLTLGGLKG